MTKDRIVWAIYTLTQPLYQQLALFFGILLLIVVS